MRYIKTIPITLGPENNASFVQLVPPPPPQKAATKRLLREISYGRGYLTFCFATLIFSQGLEIFFENPNLFFVLYRPKSYEN